MDPKMQDENQPAQEPEWRVGGRYGKWFVDEYRTNDKSGGTYGYALGPFNTKGLAAQTAGALNSAYATGKKAGRP